MSRATEEMVVDAVNEVLGAKRGQFEPIEAATPLADLNLDSLDVAELFMAIEDYSGVELDPDTAPALETVGDLVRLCPVAPNNHDKRGTTV
ncbi:MAG TPA: phosphopantetheine-binding protein [Conexibacter sp.]|nr:phosphopantetheine-binding protein [Conexibacter sp.]